MANLKAARRDRLVQLLFGLLVNQGVQFPLDDAIEERADLFFFSRNVKFDAAIRQIRTHPVTSKPLAAWRTDQRKPTPWTFPS